MTDSGRNKFDTLASIDDSQEELEETEVNSVEVVQEIVLIMVGSGAANSVWPIQSKKKAGTCSGKRRCHPG